MTQRIQVQGGKIVFSSVESDNVTPPAIDMIVEGEMTVGNDDLADGTIASSLNQDLILESPGTGNIRLDSNLGSVFINNAKWPSSAPSSSGCFLSSGTSLEPGNLEFLPFILGNESSDTLTESELDNLYPNARIGQQVLGPTVVYQCVNPEQWRTLSGGTGSNYLSTALKLEQFYVTNPRLADGTVYYGNWLNTYDYMSNTEIFYDSSTDQIVVDLVSDQQIILLVTVNVTVEPKSGIGNLDNQLPIGDTMYGTELTSVSGYAEINFESSPVTTHWVTVSASSQPYTEKVTWTDVYTVRCLSSPSSFRAGVYLRSFTEPTAGYSTTIAMSVTEVGIPQVF